MQKADAALKLRVTADPRCSRTVRDRTLKFARAHGVDETNLAHFLTALGEAIANAIEHAKAEHPIDVQVCVGDERIVANIRDTGVGFSGVCTTAPELPPLDAERGRGLPIMRRCSDIFRIESAPGKGTVIMIGRFLGDRACATEEACSAETESATVPAPRFG